jgi:hypothetical protein
MEINFKKFFATFSLSIFALQTACVDEETKILKDKQDCQILREEGYYFGFKEFLDAKKLIFREITNGKILKEKTITINSTNKLLDGFWIDLPIIDTKNQEYYQVVIDDIYLFTLSEVKIYAKTRSFKFGSEFLFCSVDSFKVNGQIKSGDLDIYKKDAIILPVANSKK